MRTWEITELDDERPIGTVWSLQAAGVGTADCGRDNCPGVELFADGDLVLQAIYSRGREAATLTQLGGVAAAPPGHVFSLRPTGVRKGGCE